MPTPWTYLKRPDGRIAVTLDNNVWNFLFEKGLDLAAELPAAEFAIFIPREVEIESQAIPDGEEKAALRAFIARTIERAAVTTTFVFGFAHDGPGPQRVGGWGQGTWQSQTEREFYDAIRPLYLLGRKETKSQLTRNEGDAAVAAQSFFSIVLTCENLQKTGPLRYAAERGGRVLYLPGLEASGMSLGEYIRAGHTGEGAAAPLP
jgi:hypothetical protein